MILGIDFETYYDADYSLKRMTTHEYIMDPRFHVHGAAISIDLSKSVWVSGQQLTEFFDRVTHRVGWDKVVMLGHNLKFDGCILAWRYGLRPAVYLDTLAMSQFVYGPTVSGHSLDECVLRATGVRGKARANNLADVKGVRHLTPQQEAALGDYAIDDMDETILVYDHLKGRFPKEEIKRSSWCVKLAADPVLCLDADMVSQVEQDEASKKAIVVQALGVTRSALSSNPQMATMLRGLGVEPPIKKSPTTGKDTFAFAATDMEFDALLSHEDEKVRDLVRGRLVIKSTIEETRAARFLKVHELFGGRMPVFLNYAGASQTNRLSGGGKLNQQNVGRGSRLRNAIHAPHGYVLVVADLSNIELRVNMTASNETVLRDKLAAGEDLYCLFAAGVYNRPVTKADKTERQVGKVAELSLGYAAGDATFRQMLFAQADMTVPLSFASQVVQTYRYSKPNLGVSWNNFKTWIDAMCMGSTVQSWLDAPVELHKDGMLLHGGFKIKYPDMRKEAVIDVNGSTQYKTRYTRYTGKASKGRCSLWHGMVNENCAQALARIVLADIQDNVAAQTGVLPVLQVHDELIYCVPEAMGDGLLESVLAEMHRRRPWWPSLPLAGEGGVGYRYGEIK